MCHGVSQSAVWVVQLWYSRRFILGFLRWIYYNQGSSFVVRRPILVLKCDQGFVGYKNGSNTKLECNKANYEAIQVERGPKGLVYFKGSF